MIEKKFQRKFIGFVDNLVFSDSTFAIKLYAIFREIACYMLCLSSLVLRNSTGDKANFIVYSQGRTGSTLLVNLLNSHPSIHCDREVFYLKTLFPHLFLKAKSLNYNTLHYGCKIQGKQLELQLGKSGVKLFLNELNENGWKIIYLKRNNILRHGLSRIIYRQHGVPKRHLYKNEIQKYNKKINLDINELFETINEIQNTNRIDQEVLKDIPKLIINYEDNLLKPHAHQDTMDMVFNYLGLQTYKVDSDLVRITGDDLREIIQNYEEFKSTIENSQYSMYL